MDKLIINAAVTGAVHGKADSGFLPVTPREIADDCRRCRDASCRIGAAYSPGPRQLDRRWRGLERLDDHALADQVRLNRSQSYCPGLSRKGWRQLLLQQLGKPANIAGKPDRVQLRRERVVQGR